jgi:2-polyprenyl-3-methyl-5-hydroxy-6-metoxy-1,4-benzoquinol methylase
MLHDIDMPFSLWSPMRGISTNDHIPLNFVRIPNQCITYGSAEIQTGLSGKATLRAWYFCSLHLHSSTVISHTKAMTNTLDMATIQADFDRLALLSSETWDHNNHYHRFLLRQIPQHCSDVLEIGCGSGMFARLLAQKAEHVLALDLSPQMISLARERSKQFTNIDFQVADVQPLEFSSGQFDCVVSIATLHHLPMEDILTKLKAAIAPNGTLIVLDLYQASLSDLPALLIAIPINLLLKFLKTGRIKEPETVREAWAAHGRHDSYLTLVRLLLFDLNLFGFSSAYFFVKLS